MNFNILGLICLTILAVAGITNSFQLGYEEGDIISNCLERFGGLTFENAQRLQRYKQWSDTYEEIPCFTNCYLNKMFNIYNESFGFNEQEVMRTFGKPLYEACKGQLRHGRDNCETAYKGFHCLTSLENDPFVLIESMERLSTEGKTAMKDCLYKFDPYEWDRLKDYSSFPVKEPIPCFTKCFIEDLPLFNQRTKQWQIKAMQEKLGYPLATARYNHCQVLGKRRRRNACNWMYNEFTCFVLAK